MEQITSKQGLEELIKRSNKEPVVIFKHSTTCPISAGAYSELTRLNGDVALIEVQNARELSREIAALTGINHESPQVIILRQGQAVWHASHWTITAEKITEALAKNK